MCPLLAQLEIGFFSSFSAAAVYSTNEANKAGLKQSIIFRCLWSIYSQFSMICCYITQGKRVALMSASFIIEVYFGMLHLMWT